VGAVDGEDGAPGEAALLTDCGPGQPETSRAAGANVVRNRAARKRRRYSVGNGFGLRNRVDER
jgi:hypothetical protein